MARTVTDVGDGVLLEFNVCPQLERSAITHFHSMAHRDCFIAQSIKTKVTIRGP